MAESTTPQAQGLRVPARDYLHGVVGAERLRGGWFAPLRITPRQMRVLGSVAALHPGQFRSMARCTAGIALEFSTDASTISIPLRRTPVPQGTRFVMEQIARVDEKLSSLFEDFSVEVDGKAHPYLQYFDSSLYIDMAENVGRLPGFTEAHTFRVWLPVTSGVELSEIVCDGSFIDPVPPRRTLLALGDSIVQGYAATTPALAWTARLGKMFGADVINQGIGAQVFQPGTVPRLEDAPFAIVVSYGENYRYEKLPASQVERDIRSYLAELASAYSDVPTFVVSPLWHDEQASPSESPENLALVQPLLEELCREHGFHFIDGACLLDADPALLADGYEHPGDTGMEQIADRLFLLMDQVLGDEAERRARALELLAREPMTAFPLVEQIRRGIGRVMAAGAGGVFLYDGPYNQTLYATDRRFARNVLSTCVEPAVLSMLGRVGLRDAQYILGMHHLTPCSFVVYEKDAAPALARAYDIRVLDRSYADTVLQHYDRADEMGAREVEALLDAGKILGGFEKGELVGFIGEHPEGSMGMLTILPEFRRKGWAFALEATKIADHLARGFVPWGQIWPDNTASIKLHKKMGFSFYPAESMTFMNTPAYD